MSVCFVFCVFCVFCVFYVFCVFSVCVLCSVVIMTLSCPCYCIVLHLLRCVCMSPIAHAHSPSHHTTHNPLSPPFDHHNTLPLTNRR